MYLPRTKLIWLLPLLLAAGCKSPFDRTKDASNGGALNAFGTGNLVVFSNEVKTGGGAFLYPGSENQALSFNDTSNPVSARSIRYTWNGGDVSAPGCTPNPLHVFAGFDLMHTATQGEYATTAGRNLVQAHYRHVTFYARGSLSNSTVLKVEVASPGSPGGCAPPVAAPCLVLSTNGTDNDAGNPCAQTSALAGAWGQYSMTISDSDLASVKDFFKATLIHNQGAPTDPAGSGGTVYFDNIQYTIP